MKVLIKMQMAFLMLCGFTALLPTQASSTEIVYDGKTPMAVKHDGVIYFNTGSSGDESTLDRMRREEAGKSYGSTTTDPNSDIAKLGRAMYSIGTGTQVHHHPVVQIIADSKAMGMTPAERKVWDQKQKSELEKYHKQIEENEVQNKKLLESLKNQTKFSKEIAKLKERIDEKIRAFDNIEKRALLKVVQNWTSEDANSNMASTVSAVDQLINAIDFHNEHRPSAGTSSEDHNLSAQKLKASLKDLIKAGQNIGNSEQFQGHLNQFEAAKRAGIEYLNPLASGPTASVNLQIPVPANVGAIPVAAAVLCFPGETPVCISMRESRPINMIRVGDFVESCNLESKDKTCERRRVQHVFQNTTDHLLKLTFDGKNLRATDNHPFYVINKGNWVEAKDLKKGDKLRTITGHEVVLENIEGETGHFKVYNLDVDKHHNYYAADILVHNCTLAEGLASTGVGAEIAAAIVATVGTVGCASGFGFSGSR
ncbi:MAG: polymorphic toxin-type HINT domain-containing protein [Bdellovibrionia bacterium]